MRVSEIRVKRIRVNQGLGVIAILDFLPYTPIVDFKGLISK